MTDSESKPLPAITLDEWIALNEEIAALVRAGLPLEQGLADLADDYPGRLGAFTTGLAEQLQQGASLADVIARQGSSLPPVYRAMVVAGVRSDRLPAALESLVAMSRRIVDARQAISAALFYPMLVALLAWALIALNIIVLAPIVSEVARSFHAPAGDWLAWLVDFAHAARYWLVLPPVLIVVAGLVWYILSYRPTFNLGWVPYLGQMVDWLRVATFSDVLAVLVDNHVPLDEGLELAADASGGRRLGQSAREIAAGLRRGEPLPTTAGQSGLPPMLRWLMAAGQDRGALVPALRQAAEVYRSRATRRGMLLRVGLPVFATVLLGGLATVAFGYLVFGPWISLLYKLAAA